MVKDNERLTTSLVADELTFQAPNSTFYFRFTDANFNNLKGQTTTNATARFAYTIDKTLVDAKNIMNPVGGWHRDYIYYGLTPTNPKCPFSLKYIERLTSFRVNTSDGYGKIAEQTGDPKYYSSYSSNSSTPPIAGAAWTDGFFEFAVNALVNSKATGLPTVNPKFTAKGYELFDLEYQLIIYRKCEWYQGCLGKDLYVFGVKTITPKEFLPVSQKVNLINWDLENFAPTMAITIKEVDLSQTVTTREKSSTAFATNFGLDTDGTGGDKIKMKLGLKFGITDTKAFESERTVVTILESDEVIENALVNFGDAIIISSKLTPGTTRESSFRTLEYSSGLVSFGIEPVDVTK